DRSERRRGGGKLVSVEAMAAPCAEPQCEQHEVDVAAGPVLQRDQCLGDAGPGVKSQGETPQRLTRNIWFSSHLLPHCSLPDARAANRAISRARGPSLRAAGNDDALSRA